jgi:hypothetical protein
VDETRGRCRKDCPRRTEEQRRREHPDAVPVEAPIQDIQFSDLVTGAADILEAAYRKSSRKVIDGTLGRFAKFRSELPAEQQAKNDEVDDAILFASSAMVTPMTNGKMREPSTVWNYFNQIRTSWRMHGHTPLLQDQRTRAAVNGLARMKADQEHIRRAQPFTFQHVDALMGTHPKLSAIFAIAWLSASRVGDVLQLRPEDVTVSTTDNTMRICWYRRKDWGSQGMAQTVVLPPHWTASIVANLHQLGKTDAHTVRKSLPKGFALHSFRRGAAQLVAEKSGGNVSLVQSLTMHKELATLLRYVPDLTRQRTLEASRLLVQ